MRTLKELINAYMSGSPIGQIYVKSMSILSKLPRDTDRDDIEHKICERISDDGSAVITFELMTMQES